MKKTLTTLAVAATVAIGAVAIPTPADARWHRGFPVGPVIGGLAAGVLLSGIFLGLEAVSGEPSDLIKLKRGVGSKMGQTRIGNGGDPQVKEQLLSHGGHFAMSIAAGRWR